MGQHVQLSLELSKRDRRKNLLIILYSHILTLFQSILQDMEEKRLDQACARLPDMIDSSFAAAAVVKDPLVVDCFFDEDDVQQIYRRRAYQTLPRDISGKIRYLSGQHFARRAGMSEYFAAIHRIVWGSEEAVRDDPEGYLRGEAGGAAESIRLHPLIPACESMFLATRQVADFFRIRDVDKEYYEYWRDFSNLLGQERAA